MILFQDQQKGSTLDKTFSVNAEGPNADTNELDVDDKVTKDDQREAEQEQQKNSKDDPAKEDETSDKV